jgi:hypothetical protein
MVTKREPHWNIFAHELEAVLAAHRHSLQELDPQLGIPQEKARRLQHSLLTPGSLPVLTPEEFEDLEVELSLDREEWTRLQAALLATAVERLLVYRVGHEQALQAAELLLPLLDRALHERWTLEERLGARRGPGWEAMEDAVEDLIWESIWQMLDAGTLALQLGCYVSAYREQVRALKEAREDFQEALERLHDLGAGFKTLPIWEEAQQEARRGLDSALERLDDLGIG